MNDEVLVHREGGVLIVTLNRPQVRNAANRAVAMGVAAAMDQLDADPELRVGILTGAGGHFCTGMDLKGFLTGDTPAVPGRGFCGVAERPPVKPVIAAVEGYALAGGFELALVCDLIVASREARFGIPEVKRGLVAKAGGLMRLPRQLPSRIAMELALTGDIVDAQRLHELGLLNALVEPGTALEAALVLARKIEANGPLAIAASKRIVVESQGWSPEDMFQRQQAHADPVFKSQDAREGALAFAEKRAPRWLGQ